MSLRNGTVIAVVFCSAAIAGFAYALDNVERHTLDTTGERLTDRRVHQNGSIWTVVGNDGTVGSRRGQEAVSPADLIIAGIDHIPSLEHPGGSRQEYLYAASLWVGSIVNGDTLVSLAHDGWYGPGLEFSGFEKIGFAYDSIMGRREFRCTYSDTLVAPETWDEIALRPHRPVGVEVSQVSHSWESPTYDDFVVIAYTIRNITAETIHDTYIGLYVDPDVLNGYRGISAVDDMVGTLPGTGTIYAIDNSGDLSDDGTWDFRSVRGAFGTTMLFLDPPAEDTAFNWWSSSRFPDHDWSPRRAGNVRDFGHAGSGTPLGDRNKYFVMSNGEYDYDVVYSAQDHTGNGWSPPPAPTALADDIAAGEDVRFVLSFGPYDLKPGDTVYIAFALGAADAVHVDPANFRDNFSAADPEAFLAGLNLDALAATMTRARSVYESQGQLQGAPPTRVSIAPLGDWTARCAWTPAPFADVAGYRIYRRTVDGGSWTLLGEALPEYRFWDDVVSPGIVYEYRITSLDETDTEGPSSPTAAIMLGPPPVVPELSIDRTEEGLILDWTVPRLGPEFSPITSVSLFRSRTDIHDTICLGQFPIAGGHTVVINGLSSTAERPAAIGLRGPARFSDLPPPFSDCSVQPGVEYSYYATATNEIGFESDPSRPVRAAPMIFDRRGLLIYHTAGAAEDIIIPELSRSFFMDWALTNGFDTVTVNPALNAGTRYAALSAELLSHYRCIIVASEDYAHAGLGSPLPDKLRIHLNNGGREIIVSRDTRLSASDWGVFLAGTLGILSTHFVKPMRCNNTGCSLSLTFAGAESQDPGYPELDVDSLRAFDNEFVRNWLGLGVPIIGNGFLPAVGALDSLVSGADILYTYIARSEDAIPIHGLPVAFRRVRDGGGFVFFNFPLSVMNVEAGHQALDAALADLEGSALTNLIPATAESTAGIMRWLFGTGGSAPDPSWDVNRDGRIDILDLVETAGRFRVQRQ